MKSDLRSQAKARRMKDEHLRPQLDDLLCIGLRSWLRRSSGIGQGVILTYQSLPGEPDTSAIQSDPEVVDLGVRFAVTRTPPAGRILTIHPVESEMERHRIGYLQPVADSVVIEDRTVVAVLVPGLAFDRFGNRLGFGAGYYDRLLARLDCPIRVGITDAIIPSQLPVEPHDIAMTHIATHEGVVAAVEAGGPP